MPTLNSRINQAPEAEDANRPWLLFFREVRRLAAKLDALEAERKTDP